MASGHPRSHKAREPPPSLFLHPSPAASHVSLAANNPPSPTSAAAPGSQPASSSQQTIPPPISRSGSYLNPSRNRTAQAPPPSLPTAGSSNLNNNLNPAVATTNTPSLNPGTSNVSSTGGGPIIPRLYTGESTRATDRTDALWAEMQATLEEVELSASTTSGAGGGTRVFGQEHDGKLALLRAAQVSLAQAWTRSEEAAGGGTGAGGAASSSAENEVRNLKGALADIGVAAAGVGLGSVASLGGGGGSGGGGIAEVAGKTVAASAGVGVSSVASALATGAPGVPASLAAGGDEGEIGGTRPGSSGGPGGVSGGEALGAKLEEETENDLFLARKRREANDEYFRRVELGVQDVVSKLDEVALAMRIVEEETREIWGDESAPPSAKG